MPGMWPDSLTILKQLDSVGMVIAKRFAEEDVVSFAELSKLTSVRIEQISKKAPPFGTKLKARTASTRSAFSLGPPTRA